MKRSLVYKGFSRKSKGFKAPAMSLYMVHLPTTATKTLPIPTTNFTTHPSPKPLFHLSFPPNSSLPSSLHHHHPNNKLSPLFASLPPHDPPPPPENQLDYQTLTRLAVSEFLLQLGVSHEDALSISSNSHKYTQMLSESVLELEQLDSWRNNDDNDNGGGDGEEDFVGFKEKVIRMAKEKGDNGKVAFLESVGLSLSSAISVARYLSGEPLPALIDKVKYMKDILFCGSNGEGLVGKNARRMMRHLSIPVDDDLQQTLAFFEKIEARRGGLDMLGSADASFRYLVESFPRLLLLLVGAMDKDAGKMLLKYPWILSPSIQEIIMRFSCSLMKKRVQAITFFQFTVPKLRVDRAIRSWPHILGCATSKLKLMVEQIGELGVRNKKLGQVIAKSPQLLLRKPHEFLEVVSFLEDLGFDNENVGKILARCPELFAASIEKTLTKKVEFLDSIGVSKVHLPRVINKYPEFLVRILTEPYFLGLSRRDIAFMVRRFSPLLGYSIDEVLQPKVDFLLNTMDKPLREVVDYPRYFSYSLEKKIKPDSGC
ncbi:hypothetical protein JRO89_XS09G0032500 [Xanthoceras sorbifolium]|uniref:Transcription termination factor MTERF2, chloroplastic n=1 Tax=Xanthoceras sorbifolium TaxID=99658 RepID=A0ABQ8HKD2_9ROSI|nr:hypothetical protein JRO89_XS09G0032500 [Xanthoceras sorbifolium]